MGGTGRYESDANKLLALSRLACQASSILKSIFRSTKYGWPVEKIADEFRRTMSVYANDEGNEFGPSRRGFDGGNFCGEVFGDCSIGTRSFRSRRSSRESSRSRSDEGGASVDQ